MKPLDFVLTPKGAVAFITEVSLTGGLNQASIEYLGGGNPTNEKNAWWSGSELTVIDNLPSLLSRELVHPFGNGREGALKIYPITNTPEDQENLNVNEL